MGLASLAGIALGAGKVATPNVGRVGNDYLGMLNNYQRGVPGLVSSAQQNAPNYLNLLLQGFNTAVPNTTGTATSAATGALPALIAALRGSTPGQTALTDTLTRTAQEGLDAGAALDPALERVTQQSIRGGQAARGLGYGPADVLQESSALTQLGNMLRQQRQQYATNVAGVTNMDKQSALQMLAQLIPLGYSTGTNLATGAAGQFMSPASSINLLLAPYQARAQANQASADNLRSLYQSLDANSTSFTNNMASGLMGAFL